MKNKYLIGLMGLKDGFYIKKGKIVVVVTVIVVVVVVIVFVVLFY